MLLNDLIIGKRELFSPEELKTLRNMKFSTGELKVIYSFGDNKRTQKIQNFLLPVEPKATKAEKEIVYNYVTGSLSAEGFIKLMKNYD